MPSLVQYQHVLKMVLAHAEMIATDITTLNKEDTPVAAECRSILKFIRDWGCFGFPFSEEGDFSIGPWLYRSGMPESQKEAVVIVPCFSEDAKIGLPDEWQNDTVPGLLLPNSNVIALYDVNQWSFGELALTLFHESRHARQRLGSALANLPPLDTETTHETNTWLFIIGILQEWGKEQWQYAVDREIEWLTENSPDPESGQLVFGMSRQSWMELRSLFGILDNKDKLTFRQRLVALSANMTYWPHVITSLTPEQVAHSIISHFYKQ